jgi:hypothetical protein
VSPRVQSRGLQHHSYLDHPARWQGRGSSTSRSTWSSLRRSRSGALTTDTLQRCGVGTGLASSQRTATRREPASTTAFGRREAKKLGFRARASRPNKYSSKVQQCPRRSARSNEVRTHSARFNNTKRGQCHDFASKGLGVRVPLAPPISPCQVKFQHFQAI